MLLTILNFLLTISLCFWGIGVVACLAVMLDNTPRNGTSGALGLMMLGAMLAAIAGGASGLLALFVQLV